MKQLASRAVRAVAVAALLSTFISGLAQAATPTPVVIKGTAWLQVQVQADGTLANEAASIATPLQNRAESLQTFKLLATIPPALADQLAADTADNTEYLARRAVTLSLAGRDTSAITAQLAAKQNANGGFGGAAGFKSNALDTALVMMALAQNTLAGTPAGQAARNYLLTTIQTDGGAGSGSDSARINASALALLALQMYPQDLNTATALKNINAWLLLKQGADGSWLKNSNLTALTLAAISPLVSDPTIRTTAQTYLTGLQGTDGSWGTGDPFLTAVVLRALSLVSSATPTVTSTITGQVNDQNTATALAGATVALSGASAATLTTGIDGKINLPGLAAGSYTLQISKAGYTPYTNTYQLNTSQTLNIGTIALVQTLATGIVAGQVTAAATGLPLSGVTVTLNGTTTAMTDVNGLYSFTGVIPGTVSVSASLAGYTASTGSGSVLGGQTLVFSPALYATGAAAPTTGQFTGKIIAAGSGTPLAGVSILLNGVAAGVTAADGSFNLTQPPASYTAAFTLAGYNSATSTFLLTAGATVNAGTISLTQQLTTTTISGLIKDAASGNPISGAQVQVLNGAAVTTGTNGAYILTGLVGTSFTLNVSATGYAAQSVQFMVPQPSNVIQNISLQVQTALTSSITGQVVDQNTATALAGATVSLSGAATASLTTGLDGKINIPNLVAGSYTLQISKAGYTTSTNNIQLNSGQTLNFGAIPLSQILTTSIVSGQVTAAASGLPLSGVTVTLNGATTAVTDASGFYSFASVAPGAITVSASLAGYAASSGSGSVLAGQTLVFSPALYAIGVAAPTTGQFTGKIIAAGSGAPLAGVSILLNGVAAGVTAADGSFNLTQPPASYTAAFTLAGYNSATATFLLTAGATVNAGTISLTPQLTTTTISGIVKDAVSGNPINAAQVQVLNGAVVTTGTNGAYTLTGLVGTNFNLRVSATGYVTQSMQLMVAQPGNITQDFPLQVQTGLGLSLAPLMVNPSSAASRADIGISAVVSNAASGTPVSAILTMQVVNAQGKVVSTAAAYDKTGTNLLGIFTINPGQQLPVMYRWNTGQFPPGTYNLIARIVQSGSVSQTNPLGLVLTQAQAALTVTADQHFGGTVTADPPVLQAGTNTPVHLSAILTNDGNADLPAQAYQLQVINAATGAVVATQQANGTAFAPNALQYLTFADWTPTTGGGNFNIQVQAVATPSLGSVTGTVYVGDAATAAFTVNKLAVPAGTQAVKGTIHVAGQDTTQGTVSDPLAPLIKAAVQKAVTYNDAAASSWIVNNGCSGCHVGAQALVGGEMNIKIAPNYNTVQRNIIFNTLANAQNGDGSITPYPCKTCFVQAQTNLSLWALNSWHAKQDIVPILANAAAFLISQQRSDGSWFTDHQSGWWDTLAVNTGLNTKSMVDVAALLKQTPAIVLPNVYHLTPLVTGNMIPGISKGGAVDAVGNIYVTSYWSDNLSLVKPDGTIKFLFNLPGPRPPAFASDGSLYIPTNNGVYRYSIATGQTTIITSAIVLNLALGPDGNMYAAANGGNKIIQITPAGVVSDYIVGGGLNNPYGVAFDKSGALLVANQTGHNVLKYNPDKTYSVVVPATNGEPYFILPVGTDYLVATINGLFRYDSTWLPTQLTSGVAWSLLQTLDGKILVGDGSPDLSALAYGPILTPAGLDAPISKAANWLLVDGNTNSSNNIELAFRLIGLGSAKQYYSGTAMAATLQTKMDQVGALLRSHQLADGGWGRFTYNGSDSMVTAQVGVALDSLNPSPKDPAVQNAIKLLLSRQQADGSWVSENGILSTHLAATTWVAIWLPIALNRIGGIDTNMTVSMPANITLSNPSIAPTSSVANAAGGTDYLWKLQGVTSAGADVNFDLSLANMVLGETRPVASNAYLTFNNSFTGLPVNAPIAIPSVTASAFLGLGVTTDQTNYGANSPVNITAAVNNTSTGPLDGSVKLEIYGADGILTAVVGTQPFTGLAAGAQTPINATWGTGTVAAGGYYVLATLYDAQNHQAGTAKTAFNVMSGIGAATGATGVGAKISVDKLAYQPYDRVQLASRITNLTQNQVQSGLQAVITINRPDGTKQWTQTTPLQQLLAGTFIDLGSSAQLSAAPAGQYSVILSVQTTGAAEVARAVTGYTVLSSATTGSGLTGVISAFPKVVPQTDPVIINWTVSNFGNADFTALPITVTIVDPFTQTLMSQQKFSAAMAQGKSFQTAYTWATDMATVGATYVAILETTIGGKTIVLAQDTFQVAEPPVRLDVKQSAVQENRVLVWLACNTEDEQKAADSQKAAQNDGHQANEKGGKGKKDGKKKQPIPWCVQARVVYLQNLLATLKVPYLITTNQDDFKVAFREGRYNVYWLSGDITLREKLLAKDAARKDKSHKESGSEGLFKEIREAVNRGDSLILDGAQQAQPLQEATGLTYSGQFPKANMPLTTTGLLFTAGPMPTQGVAQKAHVTTGTVQASFDVTVNADDQQKNDGQNNGQQPNDGQQQNNSYQGDDAHKPAPAWPAIIANDYGRGHALAFGFDLVDTLQNSPTPPAWSALLQTGLTHLLPPLPDTYSAGAYVELNTRIQNLAKTVDLAVYTQLPSGATLLQTVPIATLDAKGQPSWLFTLPAATTQSLLQTLRLPNLSGYYDARTTVNSIRNGKSRRYGEYGFYWTVDASDTLADKLASDLKALKLKSEEEIEARDASVVKLQRAMEYIAQTQYADALGALLEAVDKLRKISSVDISGYRLSFDSLLQETALNWLRAGGDTNTPDAQHND